MKLSNYKSLVIAILVGIVSSGLWTFLSGTVAPAVTAYLIRVSSSFSKKVFIQISSHDLTALQQSTYFLLSFSYVILVFLILFSIFFAMLYNKEKFNKIKADIYQIEAVREDSILEVSHEDLINEVKKTDKIIKKLFLFTKILFPVSLIILITLSLYSTLTSKYVYESITYFDYLIKVNSVNLDDQTEKMYMSRFTQIRNSKDYITIIVELEKLALKNGLSFLPNSTIRKEEDLLKDHPTSKSVHWNDI
ncbi:hypothetical protein [Acinetobacter sp. XS-4]|uniref:hypothetical protein n=1 Tax=Acinetobacter sp. XS-4 TaxID=2923375 RepID=UPI00208FEDFC|nr:hypothetical protein [Acinetobacter sp. XS-4]USP41482.1 hypothetical protein MMY79_05275 [Acinetobacter sp. XS-4]